MSKMKLARAAALGLAAVTLAAGPALAVTVDNKTDKTLDVTADLGRDRARDQARRRQVGEARLPGGLRGPRRGSQQLRSDGQDRRQTRDPDGMLAYADGAVDDKAGKGKTKTN